MNKLPPVVMTRLDVQRLDSVLYDNAAPIDLVESLESEIIRARIVRSERVAPNVVTMNSRVRFLDEVTGREATLTLVYPKDAGKPDTLSVLAPAGTALLGMQVGRSIDWTAPNGRQIRLKVLDILYQPEANSDFHL